MISSGDDGTFALFVRDSLGISTPAADSIPRLTPQVSRLTGVLLPPEFPQNWDRWWLETSAQGAGREPVGLPDGLREAYRRWVDPTTPEATRARDRLSVTFSALVHELVVELEHELGRRPIFKLDIVQLPVEGQFWRRLSHDRVLISEELMASRNVLAPLESVIRDLAQ
ncbi:hypothetical protein [Lentzea kentuckyensis]|uniref:hypothetical protein n=1 Tax=Lentzea kentuckyensis TaxID=360086 RepID=UPI000A372458|nr:hypothetical protein [Lentzea kentuckyensis]